MENDLFEGYLKMSRLEGLWSNAFHMTIHANVGYKYDCPILDGMVGQNVTNCTFDLKNSNNSLLQTLA